MNDQPAERESLYVGIDPDIHLSGVATWNRKVKNLKLYNLSFFDLTEFLSYLDKNFKLRVTIEAGWMIKKTNWHRESTLSKNEHISSSIGANHQVGKLLGAYCERNNISYLFTKPRGKLDSATFKNYTKYIGKTNQEQRDAAMLVYGM